MESRDFLEIALHSPALESFEVVCQHPYFGNWASMGYKGVLNLLQNCHSLRHLSLPSLNVQTLQVISQVPHSLTSFELENVLEPQLGGGGQADEIYETVIRQAASNKARG